MNTMFIALVAAATTLLSTSNALRQSLPVCAMTGQMQWDGLSNGVNVTLFGTASEIKSQLMAADTE